MVSENLKEWIKEKREEGISDERIKKSLEKTGHDPSIVDELENPFEASESDTEPSEDLFQDSSEPEKGQVSPDSESNDPTPAQEEENQDFSSQSEIEDKNPAHEDSTGQESQRAEFNNPSGKKEKDSGFSIPDLPSPSLPSIPSISRRKAGIVLLILLVFGGGFTAYRFIPSDFTVKAPNIVLNSDVDSSTDMEKLADLDSKYSGCPDAGVRIQSVSSSERVTNAKVLVTRNEAWVVLEVMNNGELIGFSTEKMKEEGQITVDTVGDQVKLRPLGCEQFYSRKSY